LPAPAWTYSDWVTYETGTTGRIQRLRLHIQEVSDFISTGNFAVEAKSHDKGLLQEYLSELLGREKAEADASASAAGTSRAYWTRGKAAL
jgi:hypothetical protein